MAIDDTDSDTALAAPEPSASPAEFSWSGYEHDHIERSPDWYWALGIAAVCIALTAVLFHNVLFALLILMAAVSLALISRTQPPLTEFRINNRGIKIGPVLHRYDEIIGFWIDETHDTHRAPAHLLIDTTKPLAPNFIIPILDTDHEALRTFLKKHAEETPMSIPLSHKIFEALGF